MATPGQLVQVMAGVLGIPKPTVIQYDRVLAEQGLRSKAGRGTSAAKVTSRDAANLLTALAASPLFGMSAKDAVRNCEAYASLPHMPIGKNLNWSKNFTNFGLSTLAHLPEKHSFGEALTSLIAAVGKGEVFQLPDGERKRFSLATFFEVRFMAPGPHAEILIDGTKEFGLLARLIYATQRSKRNRPRQLRTRSDIWKIAPDLRQTSSIGFTTIRALGSLISDQAI